MTYRIHKSYFISKALKEAWQKLSKQDNISPFLYYNYMKNIIKQVRFFKTEIPVFYYAENEKGRIVMIAPMKKKLFHGTLDTLGNIYMCDVTDFLFSDHLSEEEKRICLNELCLFIDGPFYLSRLHEESSTAKFLGKRTKVLYEHDCVNIAFGDDYNLHIANLSKSVRQNIRTAYNRVTKSGKSIELKIHYGKINHNDSLCRDTKKCYEHRQRTMYGKNYGVFQLFRFFISERYLRHDTYSLYNNDNSVQAALYIDNEIAACMLGIITNDKSRLVIPRLAINSEYGFYSPGYLLICEMVKYFISNSTIRSLDLCRGTEKYKLDLGGEIYKTFFYLVSK